MSKQYPSFEETNGRKPIAGQDYDAEKGLCQDDYEYLNGSGRYAPDDDPQVISQIVRDALALSSGTIGSLIGKTDYESIDETQRRFVKFCERTQGTYENWVQAWDGFQEYLKSVQAYNARRLERYERFIAHAEKVNAESKSTLDLARARADVIPFGQPILLGHHSEQRDRNYRRRIENGFRKGFELQDKAKYYQEKAEAALDNNSINSADPSAVEQLTDKIAKLEAQQEQYKAINAAHKKFLKDPASLDKSDLPDGIKETIRNYVPRYSWEPHPIAPYQLTNLSANIRQAKQRLEQVQRKQSFEDRTEQIGDIKIEYAPSENRIRIYYPGRVDLETYKALKAHGYRVLRSEGEGAFSGYYNNNCLYFIKFNLKKETTS